MKFKYGLLLIASCWLQLSCTSKNPSLERAFYYWKSNEYDLNKEELAQIQELKINKLYVKFFEIEKDPVFNNRPVSKTSLRIRDKYDSWERDDSTGYYRTIPNPELNETMDKLEIIPVVYIQNEVLPGITQGVVDTLADNIVYFIDKIFKRNISEKKDYNEIQIDCDWTESTRENYFRLLETLRKKTSKTLSCTLRLYPYKYPQKMGVPPVGKATLMCYNLIPPLSREDQNSIQNNPELELYLKGAKKYPIHLDIALPVYSWMYIYQNNQFKGVVNRDLSQIDSTSLKLLKPFWYEVQEDVELDNFYLRKGDKIKLEETTAAETLKSIALLKKYLPPDGQTTLSLFHLDRKNLQQYNYETLRSFFDTFK